LGPALLLLLLMGSESEWCVCPVDCNKKAGHHPSSSRLRPGVVLLLLGASVLL
jgi:hypothetical protein